MLKLCDAVLEAIATAITDTGGPFDPAALFLGVALAIEDHGGSTVQANVTPCTGALATRQAVTPWGTPYKMQDGRWVVDSPPLSFSPASSSESQIVAAYYLNGAATSGTLLAFEEFDTPYPLVDENSVLTLVVRVTVDPSGRWGATVAWNG